MPMRSAISLCTLIGMLCASSTGAPALDETKYPDWKGRRVRSHGAEPAPWGSRNPWELGQQLPLLSQYQALIEASLKQLTAAARASDRCIASAMLCAMMAVTTRAPIYMLIETFSTLRRWAGVDEGAFAIVDGGSNYVFGADILLMPVKEGQAPPG
jgi:hypothetical protein